MASDVASVVVVSTRSVFLEMAEVVTTAVSLPELAQRWDQPSALGQMTIGALSAHCIGAIVNVETCLDNDAQATPDLEPSWAEDSVDYYMRAVEMLSYADGPEGAGQTQIRDWSNEFASLGADVVARTGRDCLERLRPRLEVPVVKSVHVFGGLHMDFDPYLETRIAELVVHLDDLAATSALGDVPIGESSPEAWAMTAELFAELAVRQHGPRAVVNALLRQERAEINIAVL